MFCCDSPCISRNQRSSAEPQRCIEASHDECGSGLHGGPEQVVWLTNVLPLREAAKETGEPAQGIRAASRPSLQEESVVHPADPTASETVMLVSSSPWRTHAGPPEPGKLNGDEATWDAFRPVIPPSSPGAAAGAIGPLAEASRGSREATTAETDHTFTITLTRPKGERLGIGVRAEHCLNALRVDELACNSVVSRWNEGHPEKALRVGDYLIQVNDRCESWEMSHECRHRRNLVLTVRQLREPIAELDDPEPPPKARGSAVRSSVLGLHFRHS